MNKKYIRCPDEECFNNAEIREIRGKKYSDCSECKQLFPIEFNEEQEMILDQRLEDLDLGLAGSQRKQIISIFKSLLTAAREEERKRCTRILEVFAKLNKWHKNGDEQENFNRAKQQMLNPKAKQKILNPND